MLEVFIGRDSFYEDLERVLINSLKGKVGKTFLNRQLGMKVYTKLAMIMELD
jgi:hypothetical protein